MLITGGAGSGKTTLARRLVDAGLVDAPLYDLDGLLILSGSLPDPDGSEGLMRELESRVKSMATAPAWVCDGSFTGWSHALLENADVIVWMHVPWRVAAYRIVARHLRAEIRRDNRFPGWRRLWRFWRWSARWYANRNPYGLNAWGNPSSLATLEDELRPFSAKVIKCRSTSQAMRALAAEQTYRGA